MKIATNVDRDAFGGINISNLALFDWLKDKDDSIVGIEIITARYILGAVIFKPYTASFFRHHIINGIDIIPRYSWEKTRNPKKHWDILIDIAKKILEKEAPDVVLANGTYFAPWILTQAAKELGIPVVLRYAGILHMEVGHKKSSIVRRLLAHEKWQAAAADVLIFPSKVCQKVVEEKIIGHRIKKAIIIPNSTQTYATRRRRPTKRYTMAAVGRWTAIKNFQSYFALHKQLLDEHWPHRAIMVTSYWDKRFNIPETIKRKDSMSQEDLHEFYRTIDLLVVTSHFETFSNVAAEALVNGTSVLVSKNVGFSEILYKAGLKRMVIDSFDDPVRVAKAVKRLAKTKLSRNEKNKVALLLDRQVVHHRILSVLNKAIKNNSK